MKHVNQRTVEAIDNMMQDIQYFLGHPRMKQRNWIEKAHDWLPALQHAKEDLQREVHQQDFVSESYESVLIAITRLGLTIEKRDSTTWGYRWHGDTLVGAFPSRADAIEAGLRAKLR